MKKLLFKAHWLIGISLGTMLAISGLTGGLMAFSPELLSWSNNLGTPVSDASGRRLSIPTLYERVRQQTVGRTIRRLDVSALPNAYATVELARDGTRVPETRLVDPYNGTLKPASVLGLWMADKMHWLREIHQGHWFPPSNPLGKPIWTLTSVAAFSLFFMALSGLYLRWPRRASRKTLSTWFRLDWRLKGRALLRNLHMVFGTVALLFYLVIAHTGTFQSTPLNWYGHSVRWLLGVPDEQHQPPPPPPSPGAKEIDISVVRGLMSGVAEVTTCDGWTLELAGEAPTLMCEANGDLVLYTGDTLPAGRAVPAEPAPASFAEALVARNQDIHEGRILGVPGAFVVMCAALMMPFFYVTGWIMYVRRRQVNACRNRPSS